MGKTLNDECHPQLWVDTYADEFFCFAFSRINNREQAEDIVQEMLMIVMLVAIFTVHIGNGFAAGDNGFEIPFYYLL